MGSLVRTVTCCRVGIFFSLGSEFCAILSRGNGKGWRILIIPFSRVGARLVTHVPHLYLVEVV